jgi:primosomal protein N' (replication factor Y)
VEAIAASPGFVAFLLDGVTGSGKTEVYMALIDATLRRDRQALVLVPEIGLTPQLMQRFRRRFPARTIAMLHSGLADGERAQAWRSAAIGDAPIVIGTRSAVFVPLARPGLIIVDEEHDLSYKQQEGFRYHARDLAVVRARDERIPVVLGSATPSLESLHNASRGHYRHLHLPERAGRARAPRIGLLDLRHQPLDEGLSPTLIQRVSEHLDASSQVLLFVNRRGYAPTLLCHECGWVARCRRCDAHLTVHARDARLRCHHCGAERPVDPQCPECGSAELLALGLGTQRLEQTLADRFPGTGIVRIDRDTTRRRGAMAERLTEVRAGTHRILVGTQMLAKGHHFPDVTLAAIIDIDQGLFSADFRAPERMAQLVVQVAGRAGRAERPGEVLIQTHHPEHPLLRTLIENGYRVFAEAALEERRAAGLPPFTSLALLRAEAPRPEAPARFLEAARRPLAAAGADEVELLGPVPAPMELRGGRYRAQLLLRAERRAPLQRVLHRAVPRLAELPEARRVRWSLDVDPMEMF